MQRSETIQEDPWTLLEAIRNDTGWSRGSAARQQFGLNEDQASSALSALVPALAAGFHKNMSSQQGLDGLLGALVRGQRGRYADDAATLGQAETVADGNSILGHVFGSKDVSRRVATRASAQTGLGENVLKGMLPVVAAMMMGTMSQRLSQPAPVPAGPGGGGDALLGMLAPMLAANRDGTMVDDVVGMVGRLLARRG